MKVCPFCGCDGPEFSETEYGPVFICTGCGAQSSPTIDRKSAEEAWNRRAYVETHWLDAIDVARLVRDERPDLAESIDLQISEQVSA